MYKQVTVWLILIVFSILFFSLPAARAEEADDSKSLEKVTLQLKWRHQFQFAGYYAAVEKGYYRDAGLEVVLKEGIPGVSFAEEVVSGRAEFGVDMPVLLLERQKGWPVVILAAIFQHSPEILIARKDSGIESPQDLIGRRVELRPRGSIESRAMFINEGIRLKDIEIIDHSWGLDDLINNRVDASAGYITDRPFLFDEKGIPYAVIRPLTYGIDFYGDCLFTSEREIMEHPERVRAFREASLRGWAYAMENPDEIIDIIRNKYNSGLSVEFLQFEAEATRKLMLPKFIEIGHMNPGRWRHIADTYVRLGMLKPGYSLEGLIYDPNPAPDYTGLRWTLGITTAALILIGVGFVVMTVFNKRLRRAVKERTTEVSVVNKKLVSEITERRQAEAEINRRMENLKIINTVIRDVSSILDLEDLLQKITKSAAELINGDGASIAIYNEEEETVTYPYHYNMPGKLREVVATKGKGLAAHVIETKKPLIINDYPGHPRALKEFVESGLKVLISVPLVFKGRAFGALGVFGLTGDKQFSGYDTELLEGVGKEAAIAIENAKLFKEIRNLSEGLEQKVMERTKELEATTEELKASKQALINLLEDANEIRGDLEKANEKLKELDRLKAMFIASMSHELRTPLNSIIGFTGLILAGMAGETNAEQRDQLQRVYASAKHLLELITDVIDISKVEAGKVEVYAEEFSLARIVAEAVSSLKPLMDNKGLDVEITVSPDIRMNTDRRRLLQCILNFLSNAVKFTESGAVCISARQVTGSDKLATGNTQHATEDFVEVSVTDTGIGIREEDLAELFNSFVRLDSPLKLTTPGTGLGLYLTKKLAVEVLGGSVSVESRYGEGSMFVIRVPKEI